MIQFSAQQGKFFAVLLRRDGVSGRLEGLTERPVDILICLAQAPLSARVLLNYASTMIPAMWFYQEDYRRFLDLEAIAAYFDYMFLIQNSEYLKMVEAAGAGKAVYLPVDCDPTMHAPATLTAREKAVGGHRSPFSAQGLIIACKCLLDWPGEISKFGELNGRPLPPLTRMVQEGGHRD